MLYALIAVVFMVGVIFGVVIIRITDIPTDEAFARIDRRMKAKHGLYKKSPDGRSRRSSK